MAKKWKQFDGITVTTFFEKRYNPTIGYIVSYILVLTMLGFSANFLKSLVFIFQPFFPDINPWILSGIFCIFMVLLTIRGGLKAIIQMDKVSFLITLTIVPLLVIFSWSHKPAISRATEATGYPLEFVVSLTIITMFTYILAPWYGQKIFSAKNKQIAYQATIWSAFLVAGFYGVAILAASCVSSAELTNPEAVIPYIIHTYFPPAFKMVAYVILFLIASTTIVGLWNTIASVLLAQRAMNRNSIRQSISMTMGVAIVTYLGANLFVDKILDKLILTNIPIAALSFSLLGGFYWKRVSPFASITSLITGTVGGFACYLYFGDPAYLWYWAVYLIPLHFIVGAVSTLLFPSHSTLSFKFPLPKRVGAGEQ